MRRSASYRRVIESVVMGGKDVELPGEALRLASSTLPV